MGGNKTDFKWKIEEKILKKKFWKFFSEKKLRAKK